VMLTLPVLAATTPEGTWKSFDDKTGEAKSLVRIEARSGMLFGSILEVLNPAQKDSLCEKCPGDRADKPVEGLEIIRDMKPDGGDWNGGTILDPKTGKVYKAIMKLGDSENKLTVRGHIGISLIGRSQVWKRVE